jgi:hypothetical protein
MSRFSSNWFTRLFSPARVQRSRGGFVRRTRQRLRLEQLECREVPATLTFHMSPGAENIAIRANPTVPSHVQLFNLGTNTVIQEVAISSITNIQVFCDGFTDTLTVDYHYGDPLPSGGLQYQYAAGVDTLNVNDTTNANTQTFTLTDTTVQRQGSALITFGHNINFVTINGGSGNNTYNVVNTEPQYLSTINTGSGHDTVNVQRTTGTLNINGQGGGGNDVVNLGNANSITGITGTVNIANPPSYFHVNVNDASDSSSHPNVVLSPGGLTGLAPAAINFSTTPNCVNTLTINGGNGNNTYTITGSQANQGTVLNTGAGTDIVNVQGITNTLTINGQGGGGNDVVNLGAAGSLAGIVGVVTINNGPSYFHVNVNDGSDNTTHSNVVLSSIGLTGLTLFPINFGSASINTLTISVGNGNNTYTVLGSQAYQGTTLNTGAGTDTVNVQDISNSLTINGQGGGGNDVVNLGDANSLAGITGTVNIANGPDYFHVNVNDASDSSSHPNVVLSPGGLTGLAPAAINFSTAPNCVNTLTINGGSGNNTSTITGSQAYLGTTLNTGTGTDTVNVQGSANSLQINGQGGASNDVVNLGNAGSLAGITAPVTIFNGPSFFHVNVNDGADTSSYPAVVLSPSSLTGLSPAPINFGVTSVNTLNIQGGSGSNVYTITGSQALLGTTLSTGTGSDTVNVQGITHPLTVNSAGGSGADAINLGDSSNTLAGITGAVTVQASATDTLTINDQGTAAGRTYTVGSTSITWTGGPTVSYTGVGTLAVNGGSGDDSYVLTGTSATAAVTVTGGSGNNQLTGSNTSNVWTLGGTNAGSLSGPAYASPASFSNIPNLVSGSGGDYFQFTDGAAITGNLSGGGSGTLDYSQYTTSVVVDLQVAVAGIDTGVGGVVSGITSVAGGSAAPAGPGVYNLLIGNGGDYLAGGTGRRNILVAGGSASTLVAGDGEDLLIAGSTTYDTEAGLVSWQAIAAYWAGSDDFGTRMANLLAGNGVPILDPTAGTGTVVGNGGGNTLQENGGVALVFSDGLDTLINFPVGTQQVAITP